MSYHSPAQFIRTPSPTLNRIIRANFSAPTNSYFVRMVGKLAYIFCEATVLLHRRFMIDTDRLLSRLMWFLTCVVFAVGICLTCLGAVVGAPIVQFIIEVVASMLHWIIISLNSFVQMVLYCVGILTCFVAVVGGCSIGTISVDGRGIFLATGLGFIGLIIMSSRPIFGFLLLGIGRLFYTLGPIVSLVAKMSIYLSAVGVAMSAVVFGVIGIFSPFEDRGPEPDERRRPQTPPQVQQARLPTTKPSNHFTDSFVESVWEQQASENNTSSTECVICLLGYRNMESLAILRCKHQFHTNCISKWFQSDQSCPLCRRRV